MKGSFILNFRPWAALNPPLPRSRQESEKLLTALTTSFRRQLDREYPSLHHSTDHPQNSEEPVNINSSAHVADKHLSSILNNPLFKVAPSKEAISHKTPSEQKKLMTAYPMAVLDNLLASGSPSVGHVASCLRCQLQLMLTSKAGRADAKRLMRDSNAGSKVLAWFWASNSESRKMILSCSALQYHLMKFVAAEGQQDIIMAWIHMLIKDDVGSQSGWIKEYSTWQSFRRILMAFMAGEKSFGNGLGSAIDYYLQICRMHSSLVDASGIPSTNAGEQLRAVCRHLRQWIIIAAHKQTEEIPARTYEEFMNVTSTMTTPTLSFASIPIYHPTSPDVKQFVQFTQNLTTGAYTSWEQRKKDVFRRISIDAINILNKQGESNQAMTLAYVVQDFEHSLGDTSPGTARTQDEVLISQLGSALA